LIVRTPVSKVVFSSSACSSSVVRLYVDTAHLKNYETAAAIASPVDLMPLNHGHKSRHLWADFGKEILGEQGKRKP